MKRKIVTIESINEDIKSVQIQKILRYLELRGKKVEFEHLYNLRKEKIMAPHSFLNEQLATTNSDIIFDHYLISEPERRAFCSIGNERKGVILTLKMLKGDLKGIYDEDLEIAEDFLFLNTKNNTKAEYEDLKSLLDFLKKGEKSKFNPNQVIYLNCPIKNTIEKLTDRKKYEKLCRLEEIYLFLAEGYNWDVINCFENGVPIDELKLENEIRKKCIILK